MNLLVAAVLCTALIGIARRGADAPATSDTAVIESYTLMASQGRLLAGAYSRFQWHHPGPLAFFVLAPFYALSGDKTTGLHAGAAAISIASIALVAAVLIRRRPSLAAAVCGGLAIYAWRGAEATASPWNPHVPVLPLVALIVCAADVLAGDTSTLPFVALLASLAGQSHVALMPPAVALGAAAFLRSASHAVAGHNRSSARRSLGWTCLVLAIVWMPPVIEQVTATPRGNVTELWRFFAHRHTAGQPFHVAVSAWSDMFVGVLRPDFYVAHGWPFVESPVLWAEWLTLATLALVAASVVRAWRACDPFVMWLGIALLATSAVALWSTTRIDERIFDHDVFWIVGVGLLNLSVALTFVASGLAVVAPGRTTPSASTVASGFSATLSWLLVGVAALACALEVNRAVRRSFSPSDEARVAKALADDLGAFMEHEQVRRPLIKIDQDAWGYVAGAILDLQKRGHIVSVEEDWVVMFTPAFRVNGTEDATIAVAMPPEHLRLAGRGARLISAHVPVYAHVERTE